MIPSLFGYLRGTSAPPVVRKPLRWPFPHSRYQPVN